MKKMLLKMIGEKIIAGAKRIPARIYLLFFVTLLLIGLHLMLINPFMDMFNVHKDVYLEEANVFSHKSENTELLNTLIEKERSIRDSFINVDLNTITNPIDHIKAFLLIPFAKLDTVGQCLMAMGFVLLDLKVLKLWFKLISNRFSVDERQKRKAERQSKKAIRQEEKKVKIKSKHSLENA